MGMFLTSTLSLGKTWHDSVIQRPKLDAQVPRTPKVQQVQPSAICLGATYITLTFGLHPV
jgi:hypothetical protein